MYRDSQSPVKVESWRGGCMLRLHGRSHGPELFRRLRLLLRELEKEKLFPARNVGRQGRSRKLRQGSEREVAMSMWMDGCVPVLHTSTMEMFLVYYIHTSVSCSSVKRIHLGHTHVDISSLSLPDPPLQHGLHAPRPVHKANALRMRTSPVRVLAHTFLEDGGGAHCRVPSHNGCERESPWNNLSGDTGGWSLKWLPHCRDSLATALMVMYPVGTPSGRPMSVVWGTPLGPVHQRARPPSHAPPPQNSPLPDWGGTGDPCPPRV